MAFPPFTQVEMPPPPTQMKKPLRDDSLFEKWISMIVRNTELQDPVGAVVWWAELCMQTHDPVLVIENQYAGNRLKKIIFSWPSEYFFCVNQ